MGKKNTNICRLILGLAQRLTLGQHFLEQNLKLLDPSEGSQLRFAREFGLQGA